MGEVPLYQAAYKFDEFKPTLKPEDVAARKVQGYLAHKKLPPLGPYSRSYGGPRGVGVSYERGIPVKATPPFIFAYIRMSGGTFEARCVVRNTERTSRSAAFIAYMGTSLIRNSDSLGPYSRTMHRVIRWS